MIAPQVSFASVTPIVGVIPIPAPQKKVASAAKAAPQNPDSYLGAAAQLGEEPDTPAEEGVKAEQAKAKAAKQSSVERPLADLGGTRLSILHDDDANRFANTDSKVAERQHPTGDDLQSREQAAQVLVESL